MTSKKKKTLKRTVRDERKRKIRELPALCVTKNFEEYAKSRQWDDGMMDAAAWVMHRLFMLQRNPGRKLAKDWIPFPYEEFLGMFGRKYKAIREKLKANGFLDYNGKRGYFAGSHCSEFRLCSEFRNETISGQYKLRTPELQNRYIEACSNRPRNVSQRKVDAKKNSAIFFAKPDDTLSANERAWEKKDKVKSYYHLVEEGHLSEEQFETIRRLVECTFLLNLVIDDDDLTNIAKTRYEQEEYHCSEEALKEKYRDKARATFIPKLNGIDTQGRFYTSCTGIVREMWDCVTYKGRPLASVDVGNSHANCLLAFLRDIDIHYWDHEGTHEERLANCQFSKQILMVPALTWYLEHVIGLYGYRDHFVHEESLPRTPKKKRRKMAVLFKRFSKGMYELLGSKPAENFVGDSFPYFTKPSDKAIDVVVPCSELSSSGSEYHVSRISPCDPTSLFLYCRHRTGNNKSQVFLHNQFKALFRACRFWLDPNLPPNKQSVTTTMNPPFV